MAHQQPAPKKQKTWRSPQLLSKVSATVNGAVEAISEDVTQQLSAMEDDLTQFDAATLSRVDSEVGVIEEIYCENFMCHRKMRVTLSPHINFITGENGSGKSAIIAAIQICLGASARSTHRGKSIKNLIRLGHEGNALVRITLRNDAVGSDAFRPEQFGRKIMVERLIRHDGSAEYRLKDEKGIVVSKLKTDLDAMLDHLNIQTENPCAILDQENAKLFLKGDAKAKCKFFLQSTDLDKMWTLYSNIDDETRMIVKSTLRHELAKIATLESAMKKARKLWMDGQSIKTLEVEFEMLEIELAWSFVVEEETTAAKVAEKMNQKELDAQSAAGACAKAKREVGKLEKEQTEANLALEGSSARMEQCNKQQVGVKNKIRETRRPLQAYKAELRQLAQSENRIVHRLARLQHDLQTKRENHAAMYQNLSKGNDDLRDHLHKKQHDIAQTKRELDNAKVGADAHHHALKELEDQQENYKSHIDELGREVKKTEKRYCSLREQKQNRIAAFGRNIARLQELILRQENLDRFTVPPIGPLGLYVTLPEEFMYFEAAIEVATAGVLRNYLVVNGQDKALLDSLRREARCTATEANVIIAEQSGFRYTKLDMPQGALASHAICNILQVSDDEAFNALIDICSLESKLLFDDQEEAERCVLTGSSGDFRMARRVSEVYLPSGDKFIVRQGDLAYIANKRDRRGCVISQHVDEGIANMKLKLNNLNVEMNELRRDESHLWGNIADYATTFSRTRSARTTYLGDLTSSEWSCAVSRRTWPMLRKMTLILSIRQCWRAK